MGLDGPCFSQISILYQIPPQFYGIADSFNVDLESISIFDLSLKCNIGSSDRQSVELNASNSISGALKMGNSPEKAIGRVPLSLRSSENISSPIK